jgi:hypothetical protein
VASIIVSALYVALAVLRSPNRGGQLALASPTAGASAQVPGASSQTAAAVTPSAASQGAGQATEIVFQNVQRDNGYAQVAVVPASDPSAARDITDIACERVHYAAGRGICLNADYGVIANYYADLFDSSFRPVTRIPLEGAPTRARVSPDGRYGAATTFVYGHSYADINFSTATLLIDMASGNILGNLEDFTTYRDGQQWREQDFNFWGVTFSSADSNIFYASLRSGGLTYLVKGDIGTRSMQVLHQNVECPSVSPDGTRIAYKKLGEGLVGQWRLTMLDLATMTETPLAETRNIDDQAEWLDDHTVLYGDGENIYQVPADGSGTPSMFIADGLSPAVVR